jgi:WXXGXW repeat (2 copies)
MNSRSMVRRAWMLGGLLASLVFIQSAEARVDVDIAIIAPPPPLRVERVSVRPGYIWAPGYWNWHHRRYEWIGGHWERERPGYRWVAPRWDRDDRYYRFRPGVWEHEGRGDFHHGEGRFEGRREWGERHEGRGEEHREHEHHDHGRRGWDR